MKGEESSSGCEGRRTPKATPLAINQTPPPNAISRCLLLLKSSPKQPLFSGAVVAGKASKAGVTTIAGSGGAEGAERGTDRPCLCLPSWNVRSCLFFSLFRLSHQELPAAVSSGASPRCCCCYHCHYCRPSLSRHQRHRCHPLPRPCRLRRSLRPCCCDDDGGDGGGPDYGRGLCDHASLHPLRRCCQSRCQRKPRRKRKRCYQSRRNCRFCCGCHRQRKKKRNSCCLNHRALCDGSAGLCPCWSDGHDDGRCVFHDGRDDALSCGPFSSSAPPLRCRCYRFPHRSCHSELFLSGGACSSRLRAQVVRLPFACVLLRHRQRQQLRRARRQLERPHQRHQRQGSCYSTKRMC